MKNNGRKAGKLMSEIKQFLKMVDQGAEPVFYGENFVVLDKQRFTIEVAELLDALLDLTKLSCLSGKKDLKSMGIDYNARAIMVLAKHEKVNIKAQNGLFITAEIGGV